MCLNFGCAINAPCRNAIHTSKISEGQTYTSTQFEFRYGPVTRIIQDPHNKIEWICGELPDAVLISEEKRLIVYNSQKAVFKSRSDSIDVYPDSVSYGGYLGVSSNRTHFVIDSEGNLMKSE